MTIIAGTVTTYHVSDRLEKQGYSCLTSVNADYQVFMHDGKLWNTPLGMVSVFDADGCQVAFIEEVRDATLECQADVHEF